VRFASLLSGGFTTMAVINPTEKKLANRTVCSWEFFFSAAPTAQNSPELHFHFINSFFQPSLVGSLVLLLLIQHRAGIFRENIKGTVSNNSV
jgi:hypothetical protein